MQCQKYGPQGATSKKIQQAKHYSAVLHYGIAFIISANVAITYLFPICQMQSLERIQKPNIE